MKRGFLNGPKATARLRQGASNLQHNSSAVDPPNLRFPIGKVSKVDVPHTRSGGYTACATTYTTFPLVPNPDEPVTECIFFEGSKEILMQVPHFPQPMLQPAESAHRIGVAPGKGRGLFSTLALRTGELICSDRPLLIGPRGVPTSAPPNFTPDMLIQHSLNELEKCYEVGVNRMRPHDKSVFMALANCHTQDGSGPIVGIVRTNGLGIDELQTDKAPAKGRQYTTVSQYISLLNHSCSANTAPVFHLPSLSFRLYAVRDIPAGEELTFQYIDVLACAAARQRALKPYDLVCTCTACSDPTVSDRRRAAIEAIHPNAIMWAAVNRELPDDWLINQCLEQLALLIAEGLEHHQKYFHATKTIMEAYICLGDRVGASEWAGKLHKQRWADGYAVANTGALLLSESNAYEQHPLWRARVEPDANTSTRVLQTFAKFAGTANIKPLAGGSAMMLFPVGNSL
ncbi:ER lumen protein-retaining receptor [Favolaschia claudopus]|uniref:ER lumen protein-retaining receptor n=1 Tax=Favolaschia claudopus TaxID=2862362 RepID=A0AAW0BI08_9AGAR